MSIAGTPRTARQSYVLLAHPPKLSDCEFSSDADNNVSSNLSIGAPTQHLYEYLYSYRCLYECVCAFS